jgi:hypothetical protein
MGSSGLAEAPLNTLLKPCCFKTEIALENGIERMRRVENTALMRNKTMTGTRPAAD